MSSKTTSPHFAPTSPRELIPIPNDFAPTLAPLKGRGGEVRLGPQS